MGRDGYTGLAVLAASLFLFWGTFGLEKHPMVPVGPEFYPRIVIGVTALLALCLVAADVIARRRGVAATGARRATPRVGLVLAAFGVFGLYVVALPFVGFRVATLAFMVAMQALLEPPANARRWIAVLVLAIATTVVTYYAFEHYLHVLLPRGRWTGF